MRLSKFFLFTCMAVAFAGMVACNNAGSGDTTADTTKKATGPSVSEDAVSYPSETDSVTLNGFVAYDANSNAKRPVVLVVHEWWGLNDYVRGRAKQLAEMGYLAMAVDMYGNGKTGDDPAAAGALASPFYSNPQLVKARIDAALTRIKQHPQADTTNIAAIGYCFGGSVVLNAARLGEDFKGVVSFHGDLRGPATSKDLLKAKILVCHGAADSFVPQEQVDQFKKSMDSLGADYTLKVYDSATHAFTNPNATEVGKKHNLPIAYNAAADSASWNDMKAFFARIFPR
ncbi:MAG TPA: dienelactone hydrolase family protein [Chitinophagaceae bacterium]|nr:dienelactone hydrolase family protein [Chitinophagaceae bacterium]